MTSALRGLGVPKDVVVTTPDEIARRGRLIGTVLEPALREGKVLYERPVVRSVRTDLSTRGVPDAPTKGP